MAEVLAGIEAEGLMKRERLIEGAQTDRAEYGIAVSLFAIVVTLGLVPYQGSVVRRTGSVASRARRMAT